MPRRTLPAGAPGSAGPRVAPTVRLEGWPVPGPRSYPLVGLLPRLRRDPLGVFVNLAREYGEIVRIPAGPRRVYLLNHPDHVRRVLHDNPGNYRLPPFYDKLRPIFGGGLFTSEGEAWSWRRHLLQPAFKPRQVKMRVSTISAVAVRLLERWERAAARGDSVDVAKEAAGLTVEVVARAMFGADLDGRAGELGRAIPAALETAVARTTAVADLAERLPTARNRRFVQGLRALDEAVHALNQRRRLATRRGASATTGWPS